MADAAAIVASAFRQFAPPPDLTVSEWADVERQLSRESSASPGQYQTIVTPYAREIMDCFTDHAVKEVVVMSSAQVAKTTIVENIVGYHARWDPCPILVVQPTLEMAEAMSKDRFAPMFRDSDCFHGLVDAAGSRKGGNTLLHKKFPGGQLTLAGSNSPASLAGRPIRILLCDEVDRYDVSAGTEGDPINLAVKRTTAFWNAKIGYFSTPGSKGASRIAQLYQDSDQRKFFVPCPHCNHMHTLDWVNLRWEDGASRVSDEDGRLIRRADAAWFECPECTERFSDAQRNEAVRNGVWRATQPFQGRAGFFLWQAYSPFRTALDTANEWLAAQGRPEQIRVVINTVRGETFKEAGEVIDWERLKARAEAYDFGTVPMRALFLTAGVDVQKDRIEMYVWGWARNKESWLVDFHVFPGDPSRPEIWGKLHTAVAQTYRHEAGLDIPIMRVAIDAAGGATPQVYAFTKQNTGRVIAIFGKPSGAAMIWQGNAVDVVIDKKRLKRALRPWLINVSMCKSELYGWLNMDTAAGDTAGRVHYPMAAGDQFFRQLVAEEYITGTRRGFSFGEWQLPTGTRNEALDCRNYARGAASHVGLDRWGPAQWKALEDSLYVNIEEELVAEAAATAPAAAAVAARSARPPRQRIVRSSYLGSN